MSVIVNGIPPQSFELVRDQIGAILTVEIENQFFKTGNYDLEDLIVWRERLIHFDYTELDAINVMFAGGPFSNQDTRQTDGTYNYYVDVYVRSKARDNESPDTRAMIKLHRLMGICRAILMDARYKTLGFEPPFVMHREISQIVIGDPQKMDSTTSVFGRLVISVRVNEIVDLINPPQIKDFLTQVSLELTENGYIWVGSST